MSARVTNGRTASWTTITAADAGTACSADHTESCRVTPPTTTVSGAPARPSTRRVRSTWAAGAATTIALTRGWRRKWRSAAVRIASRPRARNCLGVRRPSRAPMPPAGTTTATSARAAIALAVLFARMSEDHATGGRLQRAGHHEGHLFPHERPAVVDDHHRPVLEKTDPLSRLLALSQHLHAENRARKDVWLQRTGQVVHVEHQYAADVAETVQIVVGRHQRRTPAARQLDELQIHLAALGHVVVDDLDADAVESLQALQHVEPALAAAPLLRVTD